MRIIRAGCQTESAVWETESSRLQKLETADY